MFWASILHLKREIAGSENKSKRNQNNSTEIEKGAEIWRYLQLSSSFVIPLCPLLLCISLPTLHNNPISYLSKHLALQPLTFYVLPPITSSLTHAYFPYIPPNWDSSYPCFHPCLPFSAFLPTVTILSDSSEPTHHQQSLFSLYPPFWILRERPETSSS